MNVKLSNGFEFTVNDDLGDNMELLEALVAIDRNEDPAALSDAVRMIFGEDKQALYDACRSEDGRVPVSKIMEAIDETLNQLGEAGKKS